MWKICIGACETRGIRAVYQTDEEHVGPTINHQCESVLRCAAGTSEPFAVEVGLHQGSVFSPFLFSIMIDSLTGQNHWQMMFADDVVLCAREKDVLELELEQWREALEKRGVNVSRAKPEYMRLNRTPLGSVKMQAATGHRTDKYYVGRQTLEMVAPGRRKRRRPKQIWMDCVNRDMRAIGTTKDEVHDITCWRRSTVSVAATHTTKWERLEEEESLPIAFPLRISLSHSPSLIINAPRNMKIVTTSTIFPPTVTSSISPVVLTFVFRTFRYSLVSLLVFVTLSMISMSFVPTITVMLSAYIKFLTTSTCADSSFPFAQSFCHYFL